MAMQAPEAPFDDLDQHAIRTSCLCATVKHGVAREYTNPMRSVKELEKSVALIARLAAMPIS